MSSCPKLFRKPWWAAGGLFGCAAVAALLLAAPPPARPTVVREGVRLSGVPIGGKSPAEVAAIAQELAARLLATPIRITAGRVSELTRPGKLGGRVDPDAAVEAALAASAEPEGLIERVRDLWTRPEPVEIPLPVQFTAEGVARGLARLAVRIGAEPKNARITRVGGRFKAFPPRPGRELDAEGMAAALRNALDAPDYRRRLAESLTETDRAHWAKSLTPIALPAITRPAHARVTLEHLRPITATLASFSTSLAGSSRNRIHNVRLACNAIDGTVLLPGDVFSYNEIVGPRVPQAGYREAPVIVRGRLEPGTGGGVCQVSSTLYNAVLLADLEPIRRSHHAFPVPYVPPGRDATVVDGAIDFRFRNRLTRPIAIDAKVVVRRVVVSILGHPSDRREVELQAIGLSRIRAGRREIRDARLPRGRQVVVSRARAGARVTLVRVVRLDGKVLRREVISRDYYRPFDAVIRVGTAEPEARRVAGPAGGEAPEAARPAAGLERPPGGRSVPGAPDGEATPAVGPL